MYRHRIAVFYEDSVWGRDGFAAAKEELAKYKLKPIAHHAYPRNTVNLADTAAQIARKMPDTLIIIAHARPTYMIIRETINRGLQNCSFLATGEASLAQNRLKQARGVYLITTSVVPNPWKSKIPLAQEYRKAMKTEDRKPSLFSFEGFIIGSLLIKCLKAIAPPLTKAKIAAKLSDMTKTDIQGQTRSG